MEGIAIVLPSFNPDEKLLRVVNKLINAGFQDIIIINDGSDEQHLEPFRQLAGGPGCRILTHEVNKGKGRALKTGFAYVLEHCPHIGGVVTVDGDDQHQLEDILACGRALLAHPDSLVLGVRNFNGPQVPWRSRWGNSITIFVFRALCGIKISDTQTGLRAFSRRYLELLCQVEGERFEYETKVLLEAKARNIPFYEAPIAAVYLEKNTSSHFHALRDSVKIYGVILRFMLSSLAAAVVDIGVFTLANALLNGKLGMSRRLLAAVVGARVISALFNYICNRKAVFHSRQPHKRTFSRYVLLCCLQAAASYLLVLGLSALLPGGALADSVFKIAVDILLFFLSFRIQQRWIF
jgi:glycosyltransferase involved in cell wall biosynthesis